MVKFVPKRSNGSSLSGFRGGNNDIAEIQEKINSKNLPDHVK
jgi:hypothetical protein